MNYRDFLQGQIYKVLDPLLHLLLRLHITPNVVTVAGLAGNAAAACLFVLAGLAGRFGETGNAGSTAMPVLWGGIVMLLAGLTDMMDGRLARLGGLSTRFGALLDSTLDRYSELLTLSGITFLLLRSGDAWLWAAVMAFAAIAGSMMVSYVRARAEGLGIACKVGLMQRPERVVVTAVAAIASGLTANLLWLAIGMTVIAVLANVTALWRIMHCQKALLTTVLALALCAVTATPQEMRLLHKYDETNSSLEGHTTQILQDRDGFLWISTWNGIYRFDGYEFRRMKPTLSDTCSMTSDRIRDIWLSKDGNIYVHNNEGIFHFDIRTYRFRNLRDEAEKEEAERQRDDQPTRGSHDGEKLSYIDPQGIQWLFHKDALFCLSPMESPAIPLPMEQPTMVCCLKQDSRKQVWVATKEDRTLRLLGSDGQLLGYMGPGGTLSANYQEFGHAAYCITESSNKQIWLGTKPDGLFRLTPLATPGESPRYRVEAIEGLDNTAVYGITEDKQGRLWVATLGGGISVVENPAADKPTITNHLPGFPDDVCQSVRHIHINKKGVMLAATTEGLMVASVEHDARKMKFKRHIKVPERGSSLSCNAVMDIVETAEGRIFLATETGGINEIVSADLLSDTLSFKHYDMSSGLLPTDMIIAMSVMPNGHLIVTGNTIVIMLDVVNDRFESLRHRFFHRVYHFSQARPLLMPNGQWIMGCLDGGFTLSANAAYPNNYQPPLQLTSISFSNEKPLLAVTHTDTLRLNPQQRSLTIHFAALDYADPQAISYQYSLSTDTTETWNDLGHSHAITLLDLTPETYYLRLRSTNSDGVWTDNTRKLTIIVEPRFWEKLWVQLLMALLFTAAVALACTYIYKRRQR